MKKTNRRLVKLLIGLPYILGTLGLVMLTFQYGFDRGWVTFAQIIIIIVTPIISNLAKKLLRPK
jgi:hypothetical protein